jgi:hypothetical protein
MPLTEIAVMLIASAVTTLLAVRLVPRARQSPAFDRLLWIGTLMVALLGGWLALDSFGPPVSDLAIGDVLWLSIVLGSAGGAFALNLLLWLLDLIDRPGEDEDDAGQ